MHGRHRLQRAGGGHQEVGEGREGHGGEVGEESVTLHCSPAMFLFDLQRCAHHCGNSWPADGLAAEEGNAP